MMMNSRERVFARLAGGPVDRLPLMPITMMFAGDLAGIPYGEYCRNHRKLVEAQIRTAETFGFDCVSCISDPAREAADCGNTRPLLSDMGRLGCDIVDVDYPVPMAEARARMVDQVLLGNLNPVTVLRNGTPENVTAAVTRCHREAGARYIVGAGCEVPRDTPHTNLRALCDYARNSGGLD
jgi:uroporphyrinogen-III decarboxylase